MTVDVASTTKSLSIQTNDFAKAGLYNLQLVVYYTAYPEMADSIDFDVDIGNYCTPTLVTT